MQQCGQVHHLDDDRSLDSGVVPAACAVRGKAGQRCAKLFSMVGQGVLRVRRDLGIERLDLPGQLLLHPIEERRNRLGDLRPVGDALPGEGRFPKRGRLGFSSKHAVQKLPIGRGQVNRRSLVQAGGSVGFQSQPTG